MRTAPLIVLAIVLAMASPARADERLAFDFGYLHQRVAVTDQTALEGWGGRFAIRLSLGRHFHFGGEVDETWISGSTSLPDGAVARTADVTTSPLDGNVLAYKLLAGMHARTGSFTVGADLAVGDRDTMVSSDSGFDVAGRKFERLVEVRSRVDYWLTSTITLGAVASTDLRVREDVALGAMLAMHFGNGR